MSRKRPTISCCEQGGTKAKELSNGSRAARLSGIFLPRGITLMFVSHLLLHITSVDLLMWLRTAGARS